MKLVWFAKIGAALWSVTIARVSNGDRRDDRDDGDTALERCTRDRVRQLRFCVLGAADRSR
jgi:hypothetical protein